MLDLIDKLAGEGVADASRVFLLGFSQSCALNYRFAFTYPERLRGVVGICGGIPGDWETSTIYRQAAIDVFHLTRDGRKLSAAQQQEVIANLHRVLEGRP